MSNTSKGKGTKGSKFWIQILVNTPKLKEEFDKQIDDKLEWLSPLESEDYTEYKLNQNTLLKKAGIVLPKDYFNFWPSNQPQWDGIALSKDHKTLYLIEAKAHILEMESKLSAVSPVSRKKISNSLEEVHNKYFLEGKYQSWIDKYYQLGNRLTFLKKMNERLPKSIEHVKLVLINFAEDLDYIYVTSPEWKKHYTEAWNKMTGTKKCPDDVITVTFSVKNRCIRPDLISSNTNGQKHLISNGKYEVKKIYKDITLSNAEQYVDFILEHLNDFRNYDNFLIDMRDSYIMERKGHLNIEEFKDIPRRENGQVIRKEEWICKNMFGKELNKIVTIVDYQIPLKCPKSQNNVGLGKIDLLSITGNEAILLEFKAEESAEHPLKAIMEVYTYWMHMSGNNAEEFIKKSRAAGTKKLRKGIIIYGTEKSRIFHMLQQSKKTQQVMEELEVELFRVSPIGELEFAIKA